jgi:hypothetical protein
VVIVSPAADPRRGGFRPVQLRVSNRKNSDIIEPEKISNVSVRDPARADESDSRFHAEAPGDFTIWLFTRFRAGIAARDRLDTLS